MMDQDDFYTGPREAFVEVNDRHVAVRLRTRNRAASNDGASCLAHTANTLHARLSRRPRLSTDNQWWGVYFEFEAFRDGNIVADGVKAALMAMEYTLTKERFDV